MGRIAMKATIAELVANAAKIRNQPPVDRCYVEQALKLIKDGREVVERYPNGAPSLKDVYDIAVRLESTQSTKN